MKNYLLLLTFYGLFSAGIFGQDSTLNSICNQLDSTITDDINQETKIALYNSAVADSLSSIPDSLHEVFLAKFDSSCATAKKIKEASIKAYFTTEKEPLSVFLSKTCSKEWNSIEVNKQIATLKAKKNYNEDFTRKIVGELCKHIKYDDYLFLPEYIRYRLIERLANYIKDTKQ